MVRRHGKLWQWAGGRGQGVRNTDTAELTGIPTTLTPRNLLYNMITILL